MLAAWDTDPMSGRDEKFGRPELGLSFRTTCATDSPLDDVLKRQKTAVQKCGPEKSTVCGDHPMAFHTTKISDLFVVCKTHQQKYTVDVRMSPENLYEINRALEMIASSVAWCKKTLKHPFMKHYKTTVVDVDREASESSERVKTISSSRCFPSGTEMCDAVVPRWSSCESLENVSLVNLPPPGDGRSGIKGSGMKRVQ